MIDLPTSPDLFENDSFLAQPLLRDQHCYRLTDRFVSRVAEDTFRALIPTQNNTIEVLADDRIVSRLDNGGQELRQLGSLTLFSARTAMIRSEWKYPPLEHAQQ
jgi:hypothetical protein